jgi:hypothetical protein
MHPNPRFPAARARDAALLRLRALNRQVAVAAVVLVVAFTALAAHATPVKQRVRTPARVSAAHPSSATRRTRVTPAHRRHHRRRHRHASHAQSSSARAVPGASPSTAAAPAATAPPSQVAAPAATAPPSQVAAPAATAQPPVAVSGGS